MKKAIFLILISSSLVAQNFTPQEISKWKQQAQGVTIVRDSWGIPHITGRTDADAIFGLLYAQCEDDFARVERNYLIASARMAEVEGEGFIFNDLRMRLFIDTVKAIEYYKKSPDWMRKNCTAFADGINYYLYTHSGVKPRLIKRFQPWMPLLFSEGSIGGDIETISLNKLKEFYGKTPMAIKEEINDDGNEPEPRGSNGIAIAPFKSISGKLAPVNPRRARMR